jgi:hypothetical protein
MEEDGEDEDETDDEEDKDIDAGNYKGIYFGNDNG